MKPSRPLASEWRGQHAFGTLAHVACMHALGAVVTLLQLVPRISGWPGLACPAHSLKRSQRSGSGSGRGRGCWRDSPRVVKE